MSGDDEEDIILKEKIWGGNKLNTILSIINQRNEMFFYYKMSLLLRWRTEV